MMEPLNFVIKNLPQQSWFEVWIPITIAVLSFIISVITVWFNINSNRKKSRPFLFAGNFGYIDECNKLQQGNNVIMFILLNSPANILFRQVIYNYELSDKRIILVDEIRKNFLMYPTSNNQSTFDIASSDFEKYKNNITNDKKLIRSVVLNYKGLEGGKKYRFKLVQEFNTKSEKWDEILIEAD
jgi:hypothetical protein